MKLLVLLTLPLDVESLENIQELVEAQRKYKQAFLNRRVVVLLVSLLVQPIAIEPTERREDDERSVDLVLHLLRNLLFVPDRDGLVHDDLVLLLHEEHMIQALCIIVQQAVQVVRATSRATTLNTTTTTSIALE